MIFHGATSVTREASFNVVQFLSSRDFFAITFSWRWKGERRAPRHLPRAAGFRLSDSISFFWKSRQSSPLENGKRHIGRFPSRILQGFKQLRMRHGSILGTMARRIFYKWKYLQYSRQCDFPARSAVSIGPVCTWAKIFIVMKTHISIKRKLNYITIWEVKVINCVTKKYLKEIITDIIWGKSTASLFHKSYATYKRNRRL